MAIRYQFGPELFSGSQWAEMYYACESRLLKTDQREMAGARQATKGELARIAYSCRAKAARVRAGELGPMIEGDVDIDAWAHELELTAEKVERIYLS